MGIDARLVPSFAAEGAQPRSRRDVGEPGRYVQARRRRRERVEGEGFQQGGGGAPGDRQGDHRRRAAQGAFSGSAPLYLPCVCLVLFTGDHSS